MITQALLPLLRKSECPRIVNVASQAGHLNIIKSDALKARFVDCTSLDELEALMRSFITDVEGGVHASNGWPNTCYGMSKLGVIAMTRIIAREEEQHAPAMRVNSCCPGYCATDMSSHKGTRSAEHGACTPALLALTTAETPGPTGKFFLDELEKEW